MSSFFGKSDISQQAAYIPPQAPTPPANPVVLGANPAPKKGQPKSQQPTFLAGGDIPQATNKGNKTLLGQA